MYRYEVELFDLCCDKTSDIQRYLNRCGKLGGRLHTYTTEGNDVNVVVEYEEKEECSPLQAGHGSD